jgi:Domain of unknown function (DUF4157)
LPNRSSSGATFAPILQRKCDCGQHTVGGGECEECKKKKGMLQRESNGARSPAIVPPIVHDVLRSPGQSLDAATRAYFEARFEHDFSRVRVHTDDTAAESARAVNALAYTVGSDVVFGAGQYLRTHKGEEVLAHELVHVMQQGAGAVPQELAIGSADSEREREADALSRGVPVANAISAAGMSLRRKVLVGSPATNIPNPGGKGRVQTNAKTIEDYLKTLCPTGNVAVDGKSGQAKIDTGFCTPVALPAGVAGPPAPSAAQRSKTATGCGCICDLVSSSHQWKIVVDDGAWPHTDFDDNDAAIGKKPGGSGGAVTAPSPNSPKFWGAGAASGKQLDIDPWLVLGHELCGHGWLGNSGSHGPDETSPRGEGGHQETVKRENLLRAEHGIDLRGTFKDPDCGESYWRDKASPGKVNWSSFHTVCQSWRTKYNAANGTSYKITDKIP